MQRNYEQIKIIFSSTFLIINTGKLIIIIHVKNTYSGVCMVLGAETTKMGLHIGKFLALKKLPIK
jgi:hypothetical protein